jgi:hypothetical protein
VPAREEEEMSILVTISVLAAIISVTIAVNTLMEERELKKQLKELRSRRR